MNTYVDIYVDDHCKEILLNECFVKVIYARCQFSNNPHAAILMEYKIPIPKFGQTYENLYDVEEVLNVVYRLQDIRSGIDFPIDCQGDFIMTEDILQFFSLCQCIAGNRYVAHLMYLIDFMR